MCDDKGFNERDPKERIKEEIVSVFPTRERKREREGERERKRPLLQFLTSQSPLELGGGEGGEWRAHSLARRTDRLDLEEEEEEEEEEEGTAASRPVQITLRPRSYSSLHQSRSIGRKSQLVHSMTSGRSSSPLFLTREPTLYERLHGIQHRKWNETKQQPSMATHLVSFQSQC